MSLIKPWMNKNESKAIKAVDKLKDGYVLAQIALDHLSTPNVRQCAADKLFHLHDAIMYIVATWNNQGKKDSQYKNEGYSLEFVANKVPQTILVDMARCVINEATHKFVAEFLSEERAIKSFLTDNNFDSGIKFALLERIVDKEIYERLIDEIARHNGLNWEFRASALKKVKNQHLLEKILETIPDYGIELVVSLITDQRYLETSVKKVLKEYPVPEKKAIALVKKITNQKLLTDIILDDNRFEIKFAALDSVVDQKELKKIFDNSSSTGLSHIQLKAGLLLGDKAPLCASLVKVIEKGPLQITQYSQMGYFDFIVDKTRLLCELAKTHPQAIKCDRDKLIEMINSISCDIDQWISSVDDYYGEKKRERFTRKDDACTLGLVFPSLTSLK